MDSDEEQFLQDGFLLEPPGTVATDFGDNASTYNIQEGLGSTGCGFQDHDPNSYTYMLKVDTSASPAQDKEHSDAPAAILPVQNQGPSRSSKKRLKGGRRLGLSDKDKMSTAIQDATLAMEASGEGPSGAQNPKQAHNAKERLRRMNLNASYSALRSLLPNSKRSKKRWSAPKIIDKALTYIPELQNEIALLSLEKEKRALSNQTHQNHNSHVTDTSLTITEVAQGELIIQVCAKRDKGGVLSGLMRKVEDEGMRVKGASSVEISDDRISCHLQIEMNPIPTGNDYIAVLRNQLASWLD